MPRRLRPVGPDETPAKPSKLSVSEAAERGTHRQLLEALRDKIAKTIEGANCHPRDLAALSYRLQVIAKELSVSMRATLMRSVRRRARLMRLSTAAPSEHGVARSRRVKTHSWRVPAITNGTASIGNGCASRALSAVGRLTMTGPISSAAGRTLDRSWWGIVSADTRPNVPAGLKP